MKGIMKSQADTEDQESRSLLYYSWIRFKKNKIALIAGIFIVIVILSAIFAPFITPTTYKDQAYLDQAYSFPDLENWFGVDSIGRDYFTRIIYGARVSLGIGFSASFVALLFGVPIGTIAGFKGGIPDWIVMRGIEVMSVIPPLLVGLVIAAVFGGGIINIIVITAAFYWVRVARLVRGQAKSLKNENYVLAAKSFGASSIHTVKNHLIPNTVAQILVGLVLILPKAIMLEAGLSFLGLGVNPPLPSWGQMISDGLYYIFYYWHIPLFPAIALSLTILSFSIVGDGLRDALDPRMKGE